MLVTCSKVSQSRSHFVVIESIIKEARSRGAEIVSLLTLGMAERNRCDEDISFYAYLNASV